MRPAVPLLLLVAIGGAAYLASRRDEGPKATMPPAPTPSEAVQPEIKASSGDVAAPPKQPAPTAAASHHDGWLVFPDGSERQPLNGVTTAPKLTWHKMLPYTPVVRVERDAAGRDWYVHENGARSTTYVDSRGVVIADVSMPAATAPVVDEPPTEVTPK